LPSLVATCRERKKILEQDKILNADARIEADQAKWNVGAFFVAEVARGSAMFPVRVDGARRLTVRQSTHALSA
jgi:ribosomal protein S4E